MTIPADELLPDETPARRRGITPADREGDRMPDDNLEAATRIARELAYLRHIIDVLAAAGIVTRCDDTYLRLQIHLPAQERDQGVKATATVEAAAA